MLIWRQIIGILIGWGFVGSQCLIKALLAFVPFMVFWLLSPSVSKCALNSFFFTRSIRGKDRFLNEQSCARLQKNGFARGNFRLLFSRVV